MKKWLIVAAMLIAAGNVRAEPPAQESSLERSADMVLIGLPALAFGLTWVLEEAGDSAPLGFNFTQMNGSPRHDLGLALLRTGIATYGLKAAVEEERPNGEEGSFPSGHTATTFAGAEFIRKHYGWGWGAPAYAAASYVGWSRVQTLDHWWHDVLAGAAIGILSNHDLGVFELRSGRLTMLPSLVSPATTDLRGDALDRPADAQVAPGLRIEFRF